MILNEFNDGRFGFSRERAQVAPGVYEIPYWVLLPRHTEAANLLVLFCELIKVPLSYLDQNA
jgi:hypothetical protein